MIKGYERLPELSDKHNEVHRKSYLDENTTVASSSGFVAGMILMWSGTIATVPDGWYLCDGDNGTPDLRNKFIVGADADVSGVANSTVSGSAAQSGGSTTISANNLPEHTHAAGTLAADSNGAHTHVQNRFDSGSGTALQAGTAPISGAVDYGSTDSAGAHTHTISGASGNNTTTASAYTQPFYALAFIMKS